MNLDIFNNICSERIKKIKETLLEKSEQYSHNNDKLHNFRKVAAFRNISAAEALMGMMMKHITALDDYIQLCGDGDYSQVSPEQWDEKIGDIQCYLILLEAILKERVVDGSTC